MSTFTRVLAGVVVLIAPAALIGCAASPDEAEAARLQVDTPLPHDPTDSFELGPWWSDGTHLLNLRSDGGYSVYKDNNRYSRPIDRGRWGQQNYGTMWLLPYGGDEPQRVRVAITRVDGRLALQPPGLGTMYAVASPPRVREDDLLGRWNGSMGVLSLNADSTYQFSPMPGAVNAAGEIMVGHNGRWTLNGDSVTLAPSTPSVAPLTIRVRLPSPPASEGGAAAAAGEPALEGLGGAMVKAKPASA